MTGGIHRVDSTLCRFTWCSLDREGRGSVGLCWTTSDGVADCAYCKFREEQLRKQKSTKELQR